MLGTEFLWRATGLTFRIWGPAYHTVGSRAFNNDSIVRAKLKNLILLAADRKGADASQYPFSGYALLMLLLLGVVFGCRGSASFGLRVVTSNQGLGFVSRETRSKLHCDIPASLQRHYLFLRILISIFTVILVPIYILILIQIPILP